ncbi:MAG: Uma2 family endonuclease [bacterium]|nr:Uma2 family endonuclease [bacterium]
MIASEFDEWIEIQTGDVSFELISREICAKTIAFYPSVIAGRFVGYLFIYLRTHKIGFLTGEAGGYKIGDDRYVPDVAFVSYAKQAHADKKGYNGFPPDLAVEVISDSDNKKELRDLRLKISGYLNAGTIVWVVDTEEKQVEIHQIGHNPRVLGMNDVLEAPDLLPNFTLPIKDIFEE